MNTLVDQSEDSSHFNAMYVHLNDERSNDLILKFEKNKIVKEKKKKGIENFLGDIDDEI
jgi:hypothetical protein